VEEGVGGRKKRGETEERKRGEGKSVKRGIVPPVAG
jgi:hypothetical protein